MNKFEQIDLAEAAALKKSIQILLVTATEIETKQLHAELKPFPKAKRCQTLCNGNQTYYLGTLGNYSVCHVQCEMGSGPNGASQATTTEALCFWMPKAVVMVGIAFGVDAKKQAIADVLISKTIIPYNINRIGKSSVEYRGAKPYSSQTLFNRFRNTRSWKFKTTHNQYSAIIPGDILSGESLIDNLEHRKMLLKTFPTAKGGEMEGVGLCAAADAKRTPWIIVKGICDFADGNKGVNKGKRQELAAAAAVSLCKHVFSKREVFKALNCTDQTTCGCASTGKYSDLDELLFDHYDLQNEPWYLQRPSDELTQTIVAANHIWASGPSGFGKTNSLVRAALKSGAKPIMIDLSKCVGEPVETLFSTIHSDLVERAQLPIAPLPHPHQKAETLKNIATLLRHEKLQTAFILIDEIPLDQDGDFKKFVEGIFAISIGCDNGGGSKARIALASICNPEPHIRTFQEKVRRRLKFICYPEWSKSDLEQLARMLIRQLPRKFCTQETQEILTAAQRSPRYLKQLLRSCVTNPSWTVAKVIGFQAF